MPRCGGRAARQLGRPPRSLRGIVFRLQGHVEKCPGDRVTGKSQGWDSVTPGRDVCIWKARGSGAELGKVVSVPQREDLGQGTWVPFALKAMSFDKTPEFAF